MTEKYEALRDAQYRNGAGKIRSFVTGQTLVRKRSDPKPSRHFRLIESDFDRATPVAKPSQLVEREPEPGPEPEPEQISIPEPSPPSLPSPPRQQTFQKRPGPGRPRQN